ncbi:heavy metal translocating P-type ATPase [Sinomonas notoginsengisoli]|uniref:heavy metal translocating P-type ATPase n=1 Tax=Sinomonas notoginsengisoli TaxID=1457311 RepID=UPI001F3525A5|nr:heavy metal translocating P-type ATPase [Sinomonas notoginsengisoli]
MDLQGTADLPRVVELDIEGMTCASCVNRVERKLGKIGGVHASVNLPLESARVEVPAGVSDEELLSTVAAAGYSARVKAGYSAASGVGAHEADHTASSAGVTAVGPPEAEAELGHAPSSAPGPEPQQHRNRVDVLLPRLVVAAALTTPVLLISMVPAAQFMHWGWWVAALALPVVTWSAWPFHRAAAINARHGGSTMDTLVSIGVTAAYVYSLVELLLDPGTTEHPGMDMSGSGGLYFETAAVVTTFLLLGRWLEARAKSQAGDALRSLLDRGAKRATVLRGGVEAEIPADQLVPGTLFVVRPGEKIATDGVVREGASAVDASLVTGESVPVEVTAGSAVTGATVNTSGRLVVEAMRVGSDTTLAAMARLVSEAQTGKAPIARLADRISGVFVPVVLVIAALTFVLWLVVSGSLPSAFTAAVAVLVIACPCALGLATPVGLLAGSGRGSQLGILIRGPQVLEDTRAVNTIVLDKTGTVTTGRLALDTVDTFGSWDREGLLRLAGSVESASEHPLAQAIVAAARTAPDASGGGAHDGAQLPAVVGFRSAPGGGVEGTVEGHEVLVGRTDWIVERLGQAPGSGETARFAAREEDGATAVWIAADGQLAGILALRDTVKAGSADGIARLKGLGLTPVLLTGDNQAVASRVAVEIGIAPEDVFAGVRPEGKVEAVKRLQANGARVAMAGDGVNDAAALAQADLGIAMGSGTDVAREAADLTVMGDDLGQVATAIELSRKTLSIIKANLFWAFFYNAIGIPVAALGLLNPMIAGAAMAASSVLVVTNSLRLTRFKR